MKKIGEFAASLIFTFFLYLVIARSLQGVELIIALIVSFFISLVIFHYSPVKLKFFNPIRIFKMIRYIPFFLKEMIVANLKIASIVLNPKLPIKPEIKKGKMKLKSEAGRLLLSSSITLTPGTLSVDIDKDYLEIHCVSEQASADEIISRFEKYIEGITE